MDRVEFNKSVRQGTILRFNCERTKVGSTSVTYSVDVFKANSSDDDSVFSTNVTMVRVDADGKKKPLEE